MTNHEDLILIFSGSEIDVNVLKQIFDDNNIPSIVKNDSNSAKAAGFGVNLGSEANIMVPEKFLEKANELVKEFKNSFE